MKIYVLNDTSQKHAGCQATMKAFYNLLTDHKVICKHYVGSKKLNMDRLHECDAVICNGEGTMHHNGRSMMFLIDILRKAQALHKKTMLINSIWDSNVDVDDVLYKLDFISFREVLSQKSAGVGVVYPDLVFNNTYLVPKKTGEDMIFTDKTLPLVGDFQELINEMADCRMFMTSKYHGVILAIICKTPFIGMRLKTHKIEGLFKTVDTLKCSNVIKYYNDAPLLTKEIINEKLND